VNKQHRLAYLAIKETSQGKRGAVTKLLAVVGVSRQAYYKGLKRRRNRLGSPQSSAQGTDTTLV
jgi:hypothetical protein